MYWPISTPRIYATSSSRNPVFKLFESDDGLVSPSDTQPVSSPPLNRSTSQEAAGSLEDIDAQPPPTPLTPHTPAVQSVEHDDDSSSSAYPGFKAPDSNTVPSKDPILALRMSRAGHLFAVITSTSITLWQTKVSHDDLVLSLAPAN